MTHSANLERLPPPPFRVGDRAFLRTDHIRTNRTARKLTEKEIGPFPIISQPSFMFFTPQQGCQAPYLEKSGIELSDRLPGTLSGRNCVALRYTRKIAR